MAVSGYVRLLPWHLPAKLEPFVLYPKWTTQWVFNNKKKKICFRNCCQRNSAWKASLWEIWGLQTSSNSIQSHGYFLSIYSMPILWATMLCWPSRGLVEEAGMWANTLWNNIQNMMTEMCSGFRGHVQEGRYLSWVWRQNSKIQGKGKGTWRCEMAFQG